jgi:sugar/nucleoside kinase (ribokinase family)
MMLTLGGSSTNGAHNLAALGCRVGFVARIGDNPLGQIAMQPLARIGVDVARVGSVSGATKTGVTVVLQRETWRNMVSYLGTICELTFEDLDLNYLADSRHFHLSSFYLQGGLQPRVPDLFRQLKSAGLTISLDSNDDPTDRWQGAIRNALKFVDVFLPNEREARRITGTDDLQAAMRMLAAIVPVVVVKLGPAGAIAKRGDETGG